MLGSRQQTVKDYSSLIYLWSPSPSQRRWGSLFPLYRNTSRERWNVLSQEATWQTAYLRWIKMPLSVIAGCGQSQRRQTTQQPMCFPDQWTWTQWHLKGLNSHYVPPSKSEEAPKGWIWLAPFMQWCINKTQGAAAWLHDSHKRTQQSGLIFDHGTWIQK